MAKKAALLKGFRALDLTEDEYALGPMMLADMGADVIKIEPPEGARSRSRLPFSRDSADPEASLFFAGYNRGKKSITLNLENADGRALLKRLASDSHFLFECFRPDYLDGLGIGSAAIAEVSPRLVFVSVTPFGDEMPGAADLSSDLVLLAAGGMLYLMGPADRPPARLSVPQALCHAGAEAAVGALTAHYHAQRTGLGQRVVVNTQACVVWTLLNEQAFPILHGYSLKRSEAREDGYLRRGLYRCRDGHVSYALAGAASAPSTRALIEWMVERGAASAELRAIDWKLYNVRELGKMSRAEAQELIDRYENEVASFFAMLYKAEIYREAVKRRILLAPVNNAADILADPQLRAREFFAEVEDPAGGPALPFPGAFAKFSETPLSVGKRAPKIGEHNSEIYCGLLGLSRRQLCLFAATGAI